MLSENCRRCPSGFAGIHPAEGQAVVCFSRHSCRIILFGSIARLIHLPVRFRGRGGGRDFPTVKGFAVLFAGEIAQQPIHHCRSALVTAREIQQRPAQNHAIRERRDLLSELRHRAELAREAYGLAREQDASRLGAAVEAAKTLFAPGADDFAAGFSEAWQGQEDVRQQALAEERERERLHQIEEERVLFVEKAAQVWESTRQISDPELAKERQGKVVEAIEKAAEKYGVGFDDLARPINTRANEIRDDRLELERQKELEREKANERTRDRGMDYGL